MSKYLDGKFSFFKYFEQEHMSISYNLVEENKYSKTQQWQQLSIKMNYREVHRKHGNNILIYWFPKVFDEL